MESRFRRFISSKRENPGRQASVIDQDANSQLSTSTQWSLPTLHSRFRSRSSRSNDLAPEDDGCSLRAVGYNTVVAGKAPTFTSTPVKGNGPVKLQTVRRLSTGELQVSSQDDNQTREDIREGDYVVAGKNRQGAKTQVVRATRPHATPTLTPDQTCSEASASPRTPSDVSVPGRASLSSEKVRNFSRSSNRRMESGLGISPSFVATSISSQSHVNQEDDPVVEWSPRTGSSRASSSISPSFQTTEEHSGTIAALCKAEYNRLVDMYGQQKLDGVTTSFGYANGTSRRFVRPTNDPALGAELGLDILSPPSFSQIMSPAKRMSEASAAPSAYHDENSDTSSMNRASLISSCAGSSSYTTHTSATEHDAVVTREDIRKIVDQMRSNYLQAFQTLEEPRPVPPSSSKPGRSTRKKHRVKTGHSVKNSAKVSTTHADRQAVHGDRSDATDGRYRRKSSTRAMSNPVSTFGRLSPVEASPEKCQSRPTNRLQRADSATLGSIFAKLESQSRIDEHPEDMEADQGQTNLSTVVPTGLGISTSAYSLSAKAQKHHHDSHSMMVEPFTRQSKDKFFF